MKKYINKRHSENADTSTSVTVDLDVWPWPYFNFKVKKAYVIRCRLLYCALVPGTMSLNVIVCEIWPLVHFLLPLTFACDLHRPSRSLSFSSLDGRYVVVYWFQVLAQQYLKYGPLLGKTLMTSQWRHRPIDFYKIKTQID